MSGDKTRNANAIFLFVIFIWMSENMSAYKLKICEHYKSLLCSDLVEIMQVSLLPNSTVFSVTMS